MRIEEYEKVDPELEAAALGCWDEPHDPFLLDFLHVGDGRIFVNARVRTSSVDLDGCGGRTDVHEVMGLLWAAIMRANGVASVELVDFANMNPEEIYLRGLLIRQPVDTYFLADHAGFDRRLKAHTAMAAHAVARMCRVENFDDAPPKWFDTAPPWLAEVRSILKPDPKQELYGLRWNPDWLYYKPQAGGPVVVSFNDDVGLDLRLAFRSYRPRTFRMGQTLVVDAGGLRHAVPIRTLRLASRLLRAVESSKMASWTTDDARWLDSSLMIVPLESHVVVVGQGAMVAVRANCGLSAFRKAQREWEAVRADAMAIFGHSGSFAWATAVDSGRFADLARDLLEADPMNVRVQTTGSHNDRDQGRDIILERQRIKLGRDRPKIIAERVAVQVKVRSKPIGKDRALDVRDTVERHGADAYLLIAYPDVTGSFIQYSEAMLNRGLRVEWWGRAELEQRLRSNQHLAERYSDVVRYVPPRA